MEEFFNDVTTHLTKYYNGLVDVTPKIGLAIVAFLISWFIASKVQVFAGKRLRARMHDPLLANFISRLIKAVFIIIGVLIVLRIVGLRDIFASLLAGAGISAFVIGFALKDIGENFLAGILLAFKRPFAIGEVIESNGTKGKVVALNLRDTQIRTGGKDIYIPNALLVKSVLINYTNDAYLAQDVVFNVEFTSNYERAIEIIREKVKATEGVLDESGKGITVEVDAITPSAVAIKATYWVRTDVGPGDSAIKSAIIIKTLKALLDDGFRVPSNTVTQIREQQPLNKTSEK
ncbi:mechanosensitive ion channel domain-containing protein [Flavobacterium sp.]|uniref:mechanosensitive ion channel family protein n=1 Tax=Flavobacterium sp. TaxID=239 RepID=UPI0012038608|nr:mechanosensitive ion channel domain-containing protein [Flavobacterium sp.]RZJ73506.1 MAG: mechanosensitive ion channel [Flavobacterium sp.]